MIDFDFSEFRTLTADLAQIPADVIPRVRQAVETTARNMKDDARAYAKQSNSGHARRYPGRIDYEMKLNTDREISAQVGPSLGGQGSLGGVLEEGGIRSRPQRNLERAERDNLADFEKGLLKATEVNGF